jgi:hypothetical protein
LRLHDLHAHQVAVRAEGDAVKAADVSWWAYQHFMKKHERAIEEANLVKVPPHSTLHPIVTKRISLCVKRLIRKERAKS